MTTKTAGALRWDADAAGIVLAAILGAALVLVAGFSDASVLHGAAHDQRHAAGFPCH
jgi:cobalt transporter subunit CbtB